MGLSCMVSGKQHRVRVRRDSLKDGKISQEWMGGERKKKEEKKRNCRRSEEGGEIETDEGLLWKNVLKERTKEKDVYKCIEGRKMQDRFLEI